MNQRLILLIVLILAVAVAGFFLWPKGEKEAVTNNSNGSERQPAQDQPLSESADVTVSYTDSGFVPSTVRIKVGQSVRFLNNDEKSMWVASDPHPVHSKNPDFDARKGVSKGGEYTYTFAERGTWEYHNHIHANDGGKVIVE